MTTTSSHSIDLDKVFSEIDPEDYVGFLGFDTKRTTGKSGTQLNIRECPRCGGSDWKVYLNAETGVGCCFHGSCADHPGLNLFSLTKHLLGSSRAAFEEIERYTRMIGWRPTSAKKTEPTVVEKSDEEVLLPQSVALPYRDKIPKYLASRGFTNETISHFRMRYCERGEFLYRDSAGIRQSQYYNKRIIIPVYDLEGKLVTFQGRDITGEADKKYLFPVGLPGTARYLFDGHNAISATDIIVGEGVFDVAAIKQAFEKDPVLAQVKAVGTFGKVLSEGALDGNDQLGAFFKLKQYGLRRITMMWDGERKTTIGAIKAAKRLEKLGFEAYVALLPEGKDPNEVTKETVIRAYKEAFRATPANCLRKLATL